MKALALPVPVFFDDLGAGDVARHEVGSELDAVELQVEHLCERADEEGLGESGHADEQTVSAGEERDEKLLDDGLLSDDDLGDLAHRAS